MENTGRSHCKTFPSSLDAKIFALATCGAKVSSAAQTSFRQQIEAVLSLPQGPGHWDETARDHELREQHLNGFPKIFKQLMYMQRLCKFFPGSVQASPGVDRPFSFPHFISFARRSSSPRPPPCPRRPCRASQSPASPVVEGLDLYLPYLKHICRLASIKTVCAWTLPSKTALYQWTFMRPKRCGGKTNIAASMPTGRLYRGGIALKSLHGNHGHCKHGGTWNLLHIRMATGNFHKHV